MKLHKDRNAFQNAVRAASDHHKMRTIYIEKDYWVTYILNKLSQSEYSEIVVFKGGTSLSKVHKLIARFSEDIDLAILKSKDQSETQLRNLIRTIEKELTYDFEEAYLEGITSKQTKYRKTAYNYDRMIDTETATGIQEKLILEINCFANPVPFKPMMVNSIIAEFFENTENTNYNDQYNLNPFELNVLVPETTLIEKILALIRLSYYDDDFTRLKSKVRHFYDIYFLAKSDTCKDFINTSGFKLQFENMFEEDKTKFNDPAEWLASEYTESPIFNSFDEIWGKIKDTYNTDFRLLVHGEFPESDLIKTEVNAIIEGLKK